MKLREHSRLMGRWPPNPGGSSAHAHPEPTDCLDTLKAFHRMMKGEGGLSGIVLETRRDDQPYLREIMFCDDGFTRAFCTFLSGHKGSQVEELGRRT
jgi:hypothetical protein